MLLVGEGKKFENQKNLSYLVGTTDRWNDAKRSEEKR